jgi:hypothetical protein
MKRACMDAGWAGLLASEAHNAYWRKFVEKGLQLGVGNGGPLAEEGGLLTGR